jgi:hypothetical protein
LIAVGHLADASGVHQSYSHHEVETLARAITGNLQSLKIGCVHATKTATVSSKGYTQPRMQVLAFTQKSAGEINPGFSAQQQAPPAADPHLCPPLARPFRKPLNARTFSASLKGTFFATLFTR